MKAKIKLPNGKVIERVVTITPFGNFQMMSVRYNNEEYLIGEGDEYLRGQPKYYMLGKKLN